MVWMWRWGRERNQGQLLGLWVNHGVDSVLFIEMRRPVEQLKGEHRRFSGRVKLEMTMGDPSGGTEWTVR